ncbi:hypothetical protein PAAG_12274 [Paracoccidioides lutzii Pb01]|uniref:cutinase n=1 Tax=Paracoccidioides lutzii (strain ATCC MYA-826 / Pb01) TaxID=502779 RepID=A0A0A2V0J3_PARBA|nr:hypothetical protein PAAG_12274 [Paracoccidioides lutzii Pb01]KGQ01023.1 hypothetical protein PAAG_12274 [Paracoccidioides lutzii Pb01]
MNGIYARDDPFAPYMQNSASYTQFSIQLLNFEASKLYFLVVSASLSVSALASPTPISPDLLRRNNIKERGSIPGWDWLRGLVEGSKTGSIVENGIKENNGCQPLTLIFACGTGEIGNMGEIIGPPLAGALRTHMNGKVTIQGVNYPASALSLSQCPGSKVVLAGYSQGASVVHNASGDLKAGQVARAVLFGDPLQSIPPRSIIEKDVMSICAGGDAICRGGLDIPAHLSYAENANKAAALLVGA